MLTGAVFIDSCKDLIGSVNHTLLQDKVRYFGFEVYLTNNTRFDVSYQNVLSDLDHLSTGVPEASILGPLFLYFSSMIYLVFRICKVFKYPHDMQIE